MSHALDYIDEKMSAVIYNVFTSYNAKSLQDRVYEAAMGTVTLNEEDFPEDLKHRFREFYAWVTRVKAQGDELVTSLSC